MADVKELQKVADEQTRKDLGPASVPAEASVEILDKPIKVVLECSVCHNLDTPEGPLNRLENPGFCKHCGGAFKVVKG